VRDSSLVSALFLALGNSAGQPFKLLAIEDFAVDHAQYKFLGGASAKAVDDTLHGAHRNALAGVRSAIDESSPIDLVGTNPFLRAGAARYGWWNPSSDEWRRALRDSFLL
jgi:hypothetical protein